jgi:hypothetical protein
MAGSMMAATPAADPVPVSATSDTGDDSSNKKASSNPAITVVSGGLPIILTAPHEKVDARERPDAGKSLRDPLHLQEGLARVHRQIAGWFSELPQRVTISTCAS